ncbi:MAG TPA: acyl-CoA dehydrogenase family protein, partial [Bacillota bacterium]|nr:acyl-CoA dehydrogenase family protein [Bacillota bacterium]
YRTGGLLEDIMSSLDTSGPDGGQVTAKGIEEYALECSMNKIFATEALGYIVDEGVQIHGGYGYTSEYPIERLYRDSRIYRIFEGTNEINRNLIPVTMLRRAAKGELPLAEAIAQLKGKLAGGAFARTTEADLVQAAKDIFLLTLDAGMQKYGEALAKEQEVLGKLADMSIQAFAMESALLRAQKAAAKDGARAQLKLDMATVFVNTALIYLEGLAKETLSNLAEGDVLAEQLSNLSKLTQFSPQNIIQLRQGIADAVSAAGKYVV